MRQEEVIAFVRHAALRWLPVKRIWLFGSRARGDARPRSDYDFAIDAGEIDHSQWSRFWNDIDEQAPTLCGIDLVDYSRAAAPLLERIGAEGVLIHGS